MGLPASRFHEGLQTGPTGRSSKAMIFAVLVSLPGCLRAAFFRARPCFNPTGWLCAAPLGFSVVWPSRSAQLRPAGW